MRLTVKMCLLLIGLVAISLTATSCKSKNEPTVFLLECNIIGMDIDFLSGGYNTSEVETNLCIPVIKHLSSNKDIDLIKYQIHPAYFRIFIRTTKACDQADMYDRLKKLIDTFPDKLNTSKVYNKYDDKNKYYIFGKPLLLPVSDLKAIEQLSDVQTAMGKRQVVRLNRNRTVRYGITMQDIADSIYSAVLKNDHSLLITWDSDFSDLLITIPKTEITVPLREFVESEEIVEGIDRPWTSIVDFK